MAIVRITTFLLLALSLAAPVSTTQAGGMGIGGSVAFQCYLIAGESPGGTITLSDQFGERTVAVGGARLVCAPVLGTYFPGPDGKNPDPPDACLPGESGNCADHLKCYSYRSSGGGSPGVAVTLQDFFRPGISGVLETVTVGVPQFLCVGALKTLVP